MEFYDVHHQSNNDKKIIQIQWDMCDEQWTAVRLGEDRELGETRLWNVWFLFLLVLDWVMKNSVQGKNTGIDVSSQASWKISNMLMILHSYPASSMRLRTKQQQ